MQENRINDLFIINVKIYSVLSIVVTLLLCEPTSAQIPDSYKGKPYKPYKCYKGAQAIPGRVELAWYDLGGKGVAYQDSTPINDGAKLSYTMKQKPIGVSNNIAFFREKDGVDIAYTKHYLDFTPKNKVDPPVNQTYIGWEKDGEWTNYTVDVKVAGRYRIIALYTNKDNKSTLWLNGELASTLVLPEETGYWHFWNKATVGEISFPTTGLNLLTLKYNFGANLAYFDFVLIKPL